MATAVSPNQETHALRDKRNQAWSTCKELLDAAVKENRALTADEQQKYDSADKEVQAYTETLNKIDKAKAFDMSLAQSQGVATRNDPAWDTDIRGISPEERASGRHLRPMETASDELHDAEHRYMSDVETNEIAAFVRENRSTFRVGGPRQNQPYATVFRNNARFAHPEAGTLSYEREFHRYLLGAGMAAEMRALQADSDVAGGFTVPTQQFANQLIQAVHDQVFVLGMATNFTVTRAESLGAPALSAQLSDAQWGTELSVNVGGADTALQFGKRELKPHPIVNEILVSKKLIRTSAIDVEALVRDQMAYHFAIPLERAFLNGNAVNQPLGVYSAPVGGAGVTTDRDFTASSSKWGDSIDWVNTKFSLKGNYWARAAWVINREAVAGIRTFRDVNGQFLWSPGGFGVGLSNGQPDRLLDHPFYMSEYAPTSTAGLSASTSKTAARDGSTGALSGYVAILGDFSKYWTATALDMTVQVLTELKAETNQNAYLGRMEIDGMPVLAEAFARLILKGY